MINRIFCYDNLVAKENKNNVSIKGLILSFILLILSVVVPLLITRDTNFFQENENAKMVLICIWLFWGVVIIYKYLAAYRRMGSQRTIFAIGQDNFMYKIYIDIHADKAIMAGAIVDRIIRKFNNDKGGYIGKLIANIYAVFKTKKVLQMINNPETINRILNENTNEFISVYKIKNIHNIVEKKKRYEILCDYYDKTKNIDCEKQYVIVSKVYRNYQDIINFLSKENKL